MTLLSLASKEIRGFDVSGYGGVDLDRLGKSVVEHIIRHFGMVRYVKSGIKLYDISDKEMGVLSDCILHVLRGVDPLEGVTIYRKAVEDLLHAVADLEGKNGKGSVVDSLKREVAEEVKIFSRELVHFDGLWEL